MRIEHKGQVDGALLEAGVGRVVISRGDRGLLLADASGVLERKAGLAEITGTDTGAT